MDFRIRHVALLFLALVLAAGLASAQPGIKVSTINSSGSVTQTTINSDPGGPVTKAPTAGPNGTFKYWDVIGSGGSSTDYYNRPPFLTQPPNPQIGVGPDDIISVVNRTIVRYPNPNAAGNTGVTNPYFNPPTEAVWLDTWLGTTNLALLCPSGTGNNAVCVIDNASVRYDQLQGRFVVLFTVTDMPAHRSNFVLVTSRSAQFNRCGNTTPTPVGCPLQPGPSSPLFTPPVIAPFVGGTQTGGVNTANWFYQAIPINVSYVVQPDARGMGFAGVAGVVNTIATGGSNVAGFVTVNFCTNGGPNLPLLGGAGGTLRSCTNYFPTGARMGIDNDNIILSAPVLDQINVWNVANVPPEGSLPISGGVFMGPYVGTRVVSVAKLAVYNATALSVNQPGTTQPGTNCLGNVPVDCQAVNLSDNIMSGTVTEVLTGANAPLCAGTAVAIAALGPNVCYPTLPVAPGFNPIPAIFWEPNNLRGRALASFDAQVATLGNATAGVITPIDYLVGTAISDNFGNKGGFFGTQFFLQPIVYSCPGAAIYPGPSGVEFCGTFAGGQVADLPVLATVRTNVRTLATVNDPNTVGQGLSAINQVANDGTSTINKRIFVGDSRPQQVLFREGLLYVARTVRISDNFAAGPLGSSTVLYDVIRTCSTAAPNPTCTGYSPAGTTVGTPFLALETEWFNGQSVVDQSGNLPGFGFYTPMFESPADVTASGPTSPIALFPWLEKLFVGMTTGGTANLAATFSKNFPSLWDFRPGDDAYDTVQPYIDPYIGVVQTTVPCPNDFTVSGVATNGSRVIAIADTTGIGVGTSISGPGIPAGSTVSAFVASSPGVPGNVTVSGAALTVTGGNTCSANGGAPGTGTTACTANIAVTFSRTSATIPVTVTVVGTGGVLDNKITVSSTTGLAVGQTITSGNTGNSSPVTDKTVTFGANSPTLTVIGNTTNLGVNETVTGVASSINAATVNGSTNVVIPLASKIARGENVSGGGLPAATVVSFVVNPADATTLLVTLSAAPTATGSATTLSFNPSNCLTVPTTVTAVSTLSVVSINPNTSATCNTQSNDALVNNGVVTRYTVPANWFAGLVITNISGSVITLSGIPGGNIAATTPATNSSYPVIFGTTTTSCPMIPWSNRAGASTDPNDGSLWLFGPFAKQRLASVPGPGQWGTSMANYALDFPAVDPYNNDNTFFGDVVPGNGFFTWIQIAKNLGLAQPTATGPCNITAGNPPIQPPPAGGGTPNPGTPNLICPYFSPGQTVSRAEMAYWVIRAQMDEAMVSAYLCATGGDPSGLAACGAGGGGITASSFADLGNGGGSITNPFLASSGITQGMMMRYIEVMYRRGYTKGCSASDDPLRKFCPNDAIQRGQMSVFLIRAKMNNVFPTTLSGIPLTAPYGDNFGLFLPPAAYFSDVTQGATDPFKDYYIYIQKMRELRITNGTSGTTFSPGGSLTRQEIATFIVRAFFL